MHVSNAHAQVTYAIYLACTRYSNWLSSGLVARKGDGVHSNTTPSSEWATVANLEDFIYVRLSPTSRLDYHSLVFIFNYFLIQNF